MGRPNHLRGFCEGCNTAMQIIRLVVKMYVIYASPLFVQFCCCLQMPIIALQATLELILGMPEINVVMQDNLGLHLLSTQDVSSY